eukprot:TRINITY_DN6664_c0_g1_i1.p1 TRINITY_DN6664_c0_g1~~TRINITY_DN6664_c0_g1_i1.p1  ORF type:complete len:640 (+),score=139.56 TRINITY_DN6664_c0_g1_i1:188-1921(+)
MAKLKADHNDMCCVSHVNSNEDETDGVLFLTVHLLAGVSAANWGRDGEGSPSNASPQSVAKKRKARERTFTTLSKQPPPPVVTDDQASAAESNSPTSSIGRRISSSPLVRPAVSPAGRSGRGTDFRSPGSQRRRSSAYTPRAPTPREDGVPFDLGDLAESETHEAEIEDDSMLPEELALCLPSAPARNIDFQELFYQCSVTRKRPAARLFPKNMLAFSEEEALRYHSEHPDECVALCYDLSDYAEVAWNYKRNRWCTPTETDFFEGILEGLYDTRGEFMVDAVKDKELGTVENEAMKCGSCSMQGWRVGNEDAHNAILALPTCPDVQMFGVYDGHGGHRVARFVGENLPKIIDVNLAKMAAGRAPDHIARALEKSFLDTDTSCCAQLPQDHSATTGTTVNCILMHGDSIIIANSGDSRAVLCRSGRADRLSHDHKPDSPTELKRIKASGSRVSPDARVEGMLAVSRAMGDFDFKQAGGLPQEHQAVTAFPDIETRARGPEDHFVLQACDGIWDVMTDEEAVDFVRAHLQQGEEPVDICAALCDACLAPSIESEGLGTDNMTVNLIVFKTYEQAGRGL